MYEDVAACKSLECVRTSSASCCARVHSHAHFKKQKSEYGNAPPPPPPKISSAHSNVSGTLASRTHAHARTHARTHASAHARKRPRAHAPTRPCPHACVLLRRLRAGRASLKPETKTKRKETPGASGSKKRGRQITSKSTQPKSSTTAPRTCSTPSAPGVATVVATAISSTDSATAIFAGTPYATAVAVAATATKGQSPHSDSGS
eukprot:6197459-Pleurochrysis_carterae.AAC.1